MDVVDSIITAISFVKQPSKRRLIREAAKFKGKKGIEIGGPTRFFGLKGGFPIYLHAEKVDNVNYDSKSFFGDYEAGDTFNYHRTKVGHQFIAEATDLHMIADNSYEFLLSSHSLEHTANPIKALKEWIRILKPGGQFILLLPDKRFTMDKKREYTPFTHLLNDYNNNTTEADTTHFEDILINFDEETHKIKRENYKKLLGDNVSNRCAHHHVFSQDVVEKALQFVGFTVTSQLAMPPFHLITTAKK